MTPRRQAPRDRDATPPPRPPRASAGFSLGQPIERRHFKHTLDTMQLGVTITDLDGRIIYTNPADARLHGYAVEELLGQPVNVFSVPGRPARPLTPDEMRTAATWRRESLNQRRDGTTFVAQLLSDVIRDDDGNPLGMVTTCEDISDRREWEERLRLSRDQLDERVRERTRELSSVVDQLVTQMAEREKAEERQRALEAQLRQAQKLEAVGQLTGGIAHDFNNLLSVILANGELLSGAHPPNRDDLRTMVDDILTAARSGASLVARLLGFSRQAELRLQPLDLSVQVFDLAQMIRHLIPENVVVERSAPHPVPAVRADAAAVQQMVLNLVTNARDAMPGGGSIRLAVEPVECDEARTSGAGAPPGPYVQVSVTDTGTGMDEATRARVFEPFFTTKAPGKGTGLGMATIYGLIRQHEGLVEVESAPGRGTTVRLLFPALSDGLPARVHGDQRRGVARGSETVLVVEDDEVVRRTAERALSRFGYEVLVASDGVEAMELIRARHQDLALIVSDVVMPRVGGQALYAYLAQEGFRIPFLFASGYTNREFDAPGLPPDVPFVRKPWTLSELATQIRLALDRHRDLGKTP